MTKPITAAASLFVDDVDDCCSCSETIYHSFIDPTDPPRLLHPSREAPSTGNDDLPLSSSVNLGDPLTLKDQRSLQCARQRLKKPMDVAKSKRHPVSTCHICRPYKAAKSTLRSPEALRVLRIDVTEAEVDAKLIAERNREGTSPVFGVTIPERRPESVSLMDLVKTPSRSAGKRFELISRPRQVIVLDDFTEIDVDKYDLDDWEHVPAPNQPKPPRRSYAKVVAASA